MVVLTESQKMSDPVKKENKSQLLKRSITNIKNNAANLVDRVGVPVVIGYLNPNTNKVVFMMDSESKDLLEASSILEKLETVLNASHKSGKSSSLSLTRAATMFLILVLEANQTR